MATTPARWGRAFGALAASILGTGSVGVAHAADPTFGPHDIPTLFFISKSDDRNRVDYGMRLDANCAPAKREAIFPYWREFEHSPPVRTHSLGMFEYTAYGVSWQREAPRRNPTGSDYELQLKHVDRKVWVTVTKGSDGQCSALVRTTIAGVKYAQLLSIYVKLSGPLSVAYLDIKGRNLETGQLVEERIKK
jgi:hypothetical protein